MSYRVKICLFTRCHYINLNTFEERGILLYKIKMFLYFHVLRIEFCISFESFDLLSFLKLILAIVWYAVHSLNHFYLNHIKIYTWLFRVITIILDCPNLWERFSHCNKKYFYELRSTFQGLNGSIKFQESL